MRVSERAQAALAAYREAVVDERRLLAQARDARRQQDELLVELKQLGVPLTLVARHSAGVADVESRCREANRLRTRRSRATRRHENAVARPSTSLPAMPSSSVREEVNENMPTLIKRVTETFKVEDDEDVDDVAEELDEELEEEDEDQEEEESRSRRRKKK